MNAALRSFRGGIGSVHELPTDIAPQAGMPEQTATIAHWFCLLPPAHPLWPHYLLLCVHLRDVAGQSRPPTLRFPDASHEIDLVALNPELGPWTPDNVVEKMLAPRTKSALLMPLNVSEQLRGATDAQAKELTMLLARSLADGFLWAECDDVIGARDHWRATISATMEHLVLGHHTPERAN